MKKLFRLKRRAKRSERRGTTAVEFAVVLPIFALFCGVLLDYSRLSMAQHSLQNAVYRAGRLAMTEGVTRAEAIEAVDEYLGVFGFEAAEGSVVVGQVYLNDAGQPLALDTTSEFDSDSVEFHVEAAIPFSNASVIFAMFLPSWVEAREIRSEIRVQSERYNGFFNPAEAYAN